MSKKVLIIDDEWTIAKVLSARLGSHGFELRTAADGASGLQAACEFRPDAILLDLRMPDMDGFEVFRRLRAAPELASIPVLFLTANVHDSTLQQAKAMGAAGFFSKPYDHKEIVAALEGVMNGGVKVVAAQG